MPAALLQVWCYVTTVTWGRLFMHDLATGAAVELEGARSEPAVLAIHQDSKGFIWLGHKGCPAPCLPRQKVFSFRDQV